MYGRVSEECYVNKVSAIETKLITKSVLNFKVLTETFFSRMLLEI